MAEKKKTEESLQLLQTRYDKYWDEVKRTIEGGNAEALKAARQRTAEMDKAFARNEDLVKQNEEKDNALQKEKRLKEKTRTEKNAEIEALTNKLKAIEKENEELRCAQSIKPASLLGGDFAAIRPSPLPPPLSPIHLFLLPHRHAL